MTYEDITQAGAARSVNVALGGQDVDYYPGGVGPPKTVPAQVFESEPAIVGFDGGDQPWLTAEIYIESDAESGIAEIHINEDQVDVVVSPGGEKIRCRVIRLFEDSINGLWHLGVVK